MSSNLNVSNLASKYESAYRVVSDMWKEVLETDDIASNSNFFNLGGNSLRAMMMQVRIRETLGREIPIETFFELPELGEFCRHLEQLRLQSGAADANTVAQAVAQRPATLPLSAEQLHLWRLVARNKVRLDVTNLPIAVRLTGDLNVSALCRSLRATVWRHEALRTRIITVDGVPSQVIDPPESFVIGHADLSQCAAPLLAANVCVEKAIWEPFEAAGGPLFRAHLIRLSAQDHILAMAVHHLIGDGWSAEILGEDISAAYNAILQGTDDPLPALPLQFVDYVLLRQDWLAGPEAQKQREYWERQLADAPPAPLLGGPQKGELPDTRIGVFFPRLLMQQLVALAERESSTLFMLLLAAFNTVLCRWTRSYDICVFSATAGRNDSRIEHLIGTFARPLVIRTLFAHDMSFRQALAQVKRACIETYTHQDISPLSPALLKQRNGVPVSFVSFQLHNQRKHLWNLTDIDVQELATSPPAGEVSPLGHMVLELEQTEDGLRGPLVYSAAHLSRQEVDRFLRQLGELLQAVVQDIEEVRV